jgi:DNA-binding FadR family transcriptional regulator
VTEIPRQVPRIRKRRTEKLAEFVAHEIARDIFARKTPVGTKLPSEQVMLESYGIGRASLREGLRILEVYGLLSMKSGPGGGPVVGEVNSANFGRSATFYYHLAGATLGELMETRSALEPTIAGLAAERRNKKLLGALRTFMDRQEQLTDEDLSDINSEQYVDLTGDFHRIVTGLSGNRVLDLTAQSLLDIFSDRTDEIIFPPEHQQDVLRVHRDIGQAILDGDANQARDLMALHMKQLVEFFTKRYPGLPTELIDWR